MTPKTLYFFPIYFLLFLKLFKRNGGILPNLSILLQLFYVKRSK